MLKGQHFTLSPLELGFVELCFDTQGCKVNIIDDTSFDELSVITAILAEHAPRGVLMTSAKSHFCLGANVDNFPDLFALSPAERAAWIERIHRCFYEFERLAMPKVAAINGMALGGGAELALLADFRVADSSTQMGFPEVTLGICPCFGGMARFSHLAGITASLEWMLEGAFHPADALLDCRVVDQRCEDGQLRAAAFDMLQAAAIGERDYLVAREKKHRAVSEDQLSAEALEASLSKAKPSTNSLAAQRIHATLASILRQELDQAIASESACFLELASTPEASASVQAFLDKQAAKRAEKR